MKTIVNSVIRERKQGPARRQTRREQVPRFAQDDNFIYLVSPIYFQPYLIIDNSPGVQLLHEADDVGSDFSGRRQDELLLQLLNDLGQR